MHIVIETFATDNDMDHLVQGLSHKELHNALDLGWDANGDPLQEEIVAVDWSRK